MGVERLYQRFPPGNIVIGKVTVVYKSQRKAQLLIRNRTVMAIYNSDVMTLIVGDDVAVGGDNWMVNPMIVERLPVKVIPNVDGIKVV